MKQGVTQRFIGYLMAATTSISFGISGYFSRLLFDDGVSPLTLVEFRVLIGAICLFTILFAQKRRVIRLPTESWGWIIAFGFFLAMATYTYLLAISRLPLAIAVAIQFSATAWIALSQAIWRKRLPPWPVMIAILFAIGGVILVTDVWQQNFNGLDALGLLYAVLTTLAYIGYMLIGQQIGRTLPALTSTAYGALVASVILFLLQSPWSIPLSTWQPQHVLLILLVGIIGMALPFSLILAALRRIDSTRASTVSTLELVTASVIGYFWLNQHLTIWQIVGCLLVPIGVIILQYEQQAISLPSVSE